MYLFTIQSLTIDTGTEFNPLNRGYKKYEKQLSLEKELTILFK